MKKVLVVDDDKIGRKFMKMLVADALSSTKVEFLEAENGLEAIKLLEEIDEVHLVITDYNMPGASGMEVVRAAKRLFLDAIVIMATGNTGKEVEKKALELGVVGFFTKPFDNIRDFQNFVASILKGP